MNIDKLNPKLFVRPNLNKNETDSLKKKRKVSRLRCHTLASMDATIFVCISCRGWCPNASDCVHQLQRLVPNCSFKQWTRLSASVAVVSTVVCCWCIRLVVCISYRGWCLIVASSNESDCVHQWLLCLQLCAAGGASDWLCASVIDIGCVHQL